MEKITLSELAEALAKRKSMSKKDAESFVRTVFDTIRENLLLEEPVKVKGLGTFKLVWVDSRESVHVNTGERIVINSHSKVSFTPDKSLSDCVNRPFAAFETVILNDATRTEDMERFDVMPEGPTPVVVEEEPAPAVEEESAPVVLEEPVPAVEEEAAPVVVEEPVPVIGEESTPVVEKEPAPAVAEPVPVALETPTPIIEEEPAPTIVEEEPAPADVEEEPTPVAEEPAPASVEGAPAPVAEEELKKTGSGKLAMWLLLLLLVLAGGAYWFYTNKYVPAAGQTTAKAEPVAVEEPVREPEPAVQEDTAEVAPVATPVPEPQPAEEALSQEDLSRLVAENPQIENGEYWITGVKTVHVLEKGEDLSVLAKRYYDDKRLISYIIRMNHYTNSQASNLFVGAEVKIPELVKR